MLIAFTTVILSTDSVTKVTTTVNGIFSEVTKYFTQISVATEEDSDAVNNSA